MADISSEPSMEDILASIKKIIADDSDRKLAPPRARPGPVQDLGGKDAIAPPVASEDPSDDILELRDEAPPIVPAAPVLKMAPPAASSLEAEIVSETAAQASRSALSSLSKLVVKPEADTATNTLEGLVREMLKPMLKDWLDAHLPEVVERVVAQEVARISGRSL